MRMPIGVMVFVAGLAAGEPVLAKQLCAAKLTSTGAPREGASIRIRGVCRTNEVALDPVALDLQGPAGPPGAIGPQGPAGATGPQGPAGAGAIPCLTQVGSEAYFTGCNVNVRSGSGATDGGPNGVGNLVIGYGENPSSNTRTGSHNLVVGRDHEYTSFAGLVAGERNAVTGSGASVTGGYRNVANGLYASVSGGQCNKAGSGPAVSCGSYLGAASSVSGGGGNLATGAMNSVTGGELNVADGTLATVSGGAANDASGLQSSVSGGIQNTASGERSSILGGTGNAATTIHSTVAGGQCNVAGPGPAPSCGPFLNAATVSGGYENVASGLFAAVSGGAGVTQETDYGWSAGSLGAGGPFNGPHSSN